MTIAILGTGNMGKGLAARLAGKAEIVFGSREAGKADLGAPVLSREAAVAKADIVVLALPYAAALEAAKSLNLAGKVVVDMTNPLKPDFSGMSLGFTTSAAEEIQALAPNAHVVKAFNTIFAALFAADTSKVPVFLAGNDEAAVNKVADMSRLAGFAVEKSGGLDGARLLEPLGMLNIRLGYHLGQGTGIAPAFVRV